MLTFSQECFTPWQLIVSTLTGVYAIRNLDKILGLQGLSLYTPLCRTIFLIFTKRRSHSPTWYVTSPVRLSRMVC